MRLRRKRGAVEEREVKDEVGKMEGKSECESGGY